MINREELNVEIARLEFEESSWPNYYKLATLYGIRDQLDGPRDTGYSYATAPTEPTVANHATVEGDSDFLKAVSRKDPAKAWGIMDDLMDTLRVVNPRVYNRVMEQIRSL